VSLSVCVYAHLCRLSAVFSVESFQMWGRRDFQTNLIFHSQSSAERKRHSSEEIKHTAHVSFITTFLYQNRPLFELGNSLTENTRLFIAHRLLFHCPGVEEELVMSVVCVCVCVCNIIYTNTLCQWKCLYWLDFN